MFNKMMQTSVYWGYILQFDSFKREIDTNESFYFELKSSTLTF